MGRENADCVVANSHRVTLSPEEQPLQLTVAEQRLSAEVPGENKQIGPCFSCFFKSGVTEKVDYD